MKLKKKTPLILTLIFVLAFTSIVFAFTGEKDREAADITTVTVVVKSGDTLWSIAKKYYPNSDIRRKIFEIKQTNNISDHIFPGQTLELSIVAADN